MEVKTIEAEKWRTIPEFPIYAISNKGRVAHKKMGNIKAVREDGQIKFSKDGWQTTRSVKVLMKQIWPENK